MRKDQFIFGSILLLANKMQTIGDSTIAEITMKQWFLMMMISNMENKSPSINEIAEFTGTTRQNVKQMINSLEKKGFIISKKSEKDNRALAITLTDKCYEYFKDTEDYGDDLLNKIFGDLTNDEINSITDSINLLHKAIDNYK